jgi:hypothetical protein
MNEVTLPVQVRSNEFEFVWRPLQLREEKTEVDDITTRLVRRSPYSFEDTMNLNLCEQYFSYVSNMEKYSHSFLIHPTSHPWSLQGSCLVVVDTVCNTCSLELLRPSLELNVTFYVNKLFDHPIGARVVLPVHILKNKAVVELYTDNLCFFRCKFMVSSKL